MKHTTAVLLALLSAQLAAAAAEYPDTLGAEIEAAHGSVPKFVEVLKQHAQHALGEKDFRLAAQKYYSILHLVGANKDAMNGFTNATLQLAAEQSRDQARALLLTRLALYVDPDSTAARQALNKLSPASTAAQHDDIAKKLRDKGDTVGQYVELQEADRIAHTDLRARQMEALQKPVREQASKDLGLQDLDIRWLDSVARGRTLSKDEACAVSNNEGVYALSAHDYPRAIHCIQVALDINPNYSFAKDNMAIAYNNLAITKPPKEALPMLFKALQVQPSNVTTALNLGTVASSPRLPNDALQQLIADQQTAVKANPSASRHVAAGLSLELVDRWDDAAAEYKQANALDSKSGAQQLLDTISKRKDVYSLTKQVGSALRLDEEKRHDEAVAALLELSKKFPQESIVWSTLGDVYAGSNNDDGAMQAYEKAVALAPGDVKAKQTLEAYRKKKALRN